MRLITTACAVALGLGGIAAPVAAQQFPDRPIRLVVGYAAGGTTDLVGRIVSEQMGTVLGQRFVVENRTGAGGAIGAQTVARSTPDGYTLFQCTSGSITVNPVLPGVAQPVDVTTEIIPVANNALSQYGVVVNPASRYRNLRDIVDAARARPGTISYGSAGVGSMQHLAIERLAHMTNVEFSHIPYRGAAPAVVDLVSGRFDFTITNLADMVSQIRGGTLRLIGIADATGSPLFPETPSSQATVPNFEVTSWYGLCGPRGMPREAIAALGAAARQALADPAVRQRLVENGLIPTFEDAETFGARITADRERWRQVIRAANIQAN